MFRTAFGAAWGKAGRRRSHQARPATLLAACPTGPSFLASGSTTDIGKQPSTSWKSFLWDGKMTWLLNDKYEIAVHRWLSMGGSCLAFEIPVQYFYKPIFFPIPTAASYHRDFEGLWGTLRDCVQHLQSDSICAASLAAIHHLSLSVTHVHRIY